MPGGNYVQGNSVRGNSVQGGFCPGFIISSHASNMKHHRTYELNYAIYGL